MKVYLFISKEKEASPMYLPYSEALREKLDICQTLVDADVVAILGAWTRKGAKIARKAHRMDIPYIVCPLGDLSTINRHTHLIRRSLQTMDYQKTTCKHARRTIATTPMEKTVLEKLGWCPAVSLIRYFGYSQLCTKDATLDNWHDILATTLAAHEAAKAEAIGKQTQTAIVAQIMQIRSRMPHKNIPQKYLDDLHTLLYKDDYDEDAICEELDKLKLSAFAAAVFQAMTEKTGLTDGFMPLPARKSRKSSEILKYVRTD